ncbi:His-Xaa-Ser system protein HxsD [bacterium]|nr:His-Xaa-Ser system protein HxsD [bacterium]
MSQPQIETLDPQTATMTLSLDVGLYPRDVLYAAAYVFLDRAYVLLDRDGARYLVHLRGKQATDEPTLRAMAGELANELLAQALRLRVVRQNQKLIEDIASLAISSAAGGAVHGDESALIDLQDPGDDGFLDDPLGIAVPWEAKKGAGEQ